MKLLSTLRGLGVVSRPLGGIRSPCGLFSVRFVSSEPHTTASNALLQSRWEQLEDSVKRQIATTPKAENTQMVRSIFDSIYNFQTFIYEFDRLNPGKNPLIIKSNQLLSNVLSNETTDFNSTLLKDLFKRQPSYPTLETIINSYYSTSKEAFIDSKLAMIPFRKFIWDGDFQRGLDFIAITTGNQRFFNHRKQTIKKVLGYFGGSMAGLILGIHGVVSTFYPELIDAGAGGTTFGIYGIYACIITYFINCGFLATLSFSSRGMENGPLMFQHYTMPHDWYMKVEEMKMCSKILEADADINGMDGFATKEVVDRIQKLGFEVNEPEQEIMLRQYWYSSGEGFAWVEPDVDPAEQKWYDHLERIGVKKVWEKTHDQLNADATSESVEDDNANAELYFPEKK